MNMAKKKSQVDQLSQRDSAVGGLVMAKSGRLELGDKLFTDNIGLCSTTATYLASKEIEIGGKNAN